MINFHHLASRIRKPDYAPAAVAVWLWLAAAPLAQADIITFDSGFANGTTIPDGTASGWSDTRAISIPTITSIGQIQVYLNLSGCSSGDLYAYLAHDDGSGYVTSVLLNRVGVTATDPFGYADSALNLTLADGAANGDVHLYQGVAGYATLIASGGAFEPDGRSADPALVTDASTRDSLLSAFNGKNPNGAWTLFVADMVDDAGITSGGTVVSWGLNIANVPEPSQWAMMGVAAMAALLYYLRLRRSKVALAGSKPQ